MKRSKFTDEQILGIRTYVSEPDRGPQSWINQHAQCDAVYANRPVHPRSSWATAPSSTSSIGGATVRAPFASPACCPPQPAGATHGCDVGPSPKEPLPEPAAER